MHFTRSLWMILALLSATGAPAQPSAPINVLVMHWYDPTYSSNNDFDRALQAALRASAPEGVEYYSEYLETNKFPGDDQARILSEYLRQKYAGRKLDVIISGVNPALDFLLKYRHELLPNVPLVFANDRPVPEAILSKARATGFTFGNTYAKTLGLALKLHPRTKQLFVVSGTLNHDKALESIVRDDLRPYESAVTITYLTDLAPGELTARIRTLPKDSLIFYVWQQVLDPQGRLLEAQDVLARVADEAKVPIYGRSYAMIGRGIVGGYVWTQEGNAAKLADIVMRVVNGTLPNNMPIERGPETPMFDWRQLQRWGIDEDRLPPGSVMRFREPTMWQQYKWRMVGTIAVVMSQTVLIGALWLLRQRAQRRAAALVEAQRVVQESEERFRRVFEEGPLGLALVGKNYRFSKVNNALCQMTGYDEAALAQMSFVDITYPDDLRADVELAERLFTGEIPFYTLQKRYVKKNGEIIWINLSASVIRNQQGEPIYGLAMIEDITEVKRAQEIEDVLTSDLEHSRNEIRALAASLMRAQEDERRRVSRELHDHTCHQLGSLAREISNLAAGPLPSKNVRAKLEEIRAHVVKTSQETQQIAHQMHTSVLDDLGLVASLKDLCSQFSEQHPDIALDCEASGLPASVPREVSTCLYRVAEESLQNIAKHSGAKSISVRLDFNKGAVLLTILDDGPGFDVKAVKGKGGLGLISMEERARSVNGNLRITAPLGHGTQIALEVPLPGQQPIGRPRVLLADDHPMVLEEIRSVLAPNCEIVETVADGRALVEAALRLKPDLIVVDITMPLLNGIDAAVQIKRILPDMKLLFVTMHASTAYLKAAFEAGGTGYVLKSGLREELPDAVQRVLGGRIYVSHVLSTEYPERLQEPTLAIRSSS